MEHVKGLGKVSGTRPGKSGKLEEEASEDDVRQKKEVCGCNVKKKRRVELQSESKTKDTV